jgi:hypothetical protein
MIEKNSSINRPSALVSTRSSRCGSVLEPAEVALDAGDHTVVAGDLGVPVTVPGVVAELSSTGSCVLM